MTSTVQKLEKSKLFRSCNHIAKEIYDSADKITGMEEWHTKRKMLSSANDLLFYVAQGLSGHVIANSLFDWNYARKNAFTLRTMYKFAHDQGLLELKPELMLKIEEVIETIDENIKLSVEDQKDLNAKDLEPWLEKYKLWKEMQK